MTFLLDQPLPSALKLFFGERHHAALHVNDLGLAQAPDADVWRRAVAERLVVVTKDSDYVQLAAREPGARLLWLRCGNCSNQELEDYLNEHWPRLLVWLRTDDPMLELS